MGPGRNSLGHTKPGLLCAIPGSRPVGGAKLSGNNDRCSYPARYCYSYAADQSGRLPSRQRAAGLQRANHAAACLGIHVVSAISHDPARRLRRIVVALASVGIFGVISYSVAQRLHEIGIRMALGAEKQNIFRMVVGHGLRLALAGLALGAAATLILIQLLSSFSQLLYGVGASDPATFISVSAVLIGVAILASYLPAQRATRVDPMAALRHE